MTGENGPGGTGGGPGAPGASGAGGGAEDADRAVDEVLAGLAARWNAADSEGYARWFHPGADFVDVLGRLTRGRAAIERVHRRNFATIHLGSRVRLVRLATGRLDAGTLLGHARASMHVPAGPLAGDVAATLTLVLVGSYGTWQVRAFHNTLVREMAGVPGTGA